MTAPKPDGFFEAFYASDGAQIGVRFCELTHLAERWLEAATQFLRANGPVFKTSWGRELADVETRLTCSNGVALSTFFVGGVLVSSQLLLRGGNDEEAANVTELFIKSLRSVHLVQLSEQPEPFEHVRTLAQRPLAVFVFWPGEGVPELRLKMAHELMRHFAGALLCRVTDL